MDEDFQQEQELRDRQGGRAYRVGQVLRDSFAQADDRLEPAITRLMLELSRLGDDAPAPTRLPPVVPVVEPLRPEPRLVPRVSSLLDRLAARLRRPRPGNA